jgi:hypothetical protein
MMLFQDIVDTWKMACNAGTNWRATHALVSMVVGAGSVAAALYFVYSDSPALVRPVGSALIALVSLAWWRYLLPKARRQ